MRALRGALAAAALGLPSALLAHAMVFGRDHAVGGALQNAAFAMGSLGLLLGVALFAKSAIRLPHLISLAAAGTCWFALLESFESQHALAPAAILVAILAACIIVRAAVSALVRSVAAIARAIRAVFAPAAPEGARTAVKFTAPRALRVLAHADRLYSRPPPVLS